MQLVKKPRSKRQGQGKTVVCFPIISLRRKLCLIFQTIANWIKTIKISIGKRQQWCFSSSGMLIFSSVLTGVTSAVITAGQSLIPSVLVLIVTTWFTFRLIVLIGVGSQWTRLASCGYVSIVTFIANWKETNSCDSHVSNYCFVVYLLTLKLLGTGFKHFLFLAVWLLVAHRTILLV